jgi:hypothetical protein
LGPRLIFGWYEAVIHPAAVNYFFAEFLALGDIKKLKIFFFFCCKFDKIGFLKKNHQALKTTKL